MASANRNKRAANNQPTKPAATDKPVAKAKVDHTANLIAAVKVFATDGNVDNLQAAYVAIPAAARGKAGVAAMATAGDKVVAVIDAFNNLPAVVTSRTKAGIDDVTKANIIGIATLDVVVTGLADLIGSTTLFAMVADLSLAAKAVDSDTFVAAHKSAVVNIAKVGTGARTYNPIGMKDLIDAGTVKVGQVMTGANDVKGTVLADGKVSTTKAGKVFVGSVSATAGHHKGASQNGWEFWRIDGTLINTLR